MSWKARPSRLASPNRWFAATPELKNPPPRRLRRIPLKARRFDFCPEVTAKVLKRGERICEVPIHYRARTMVQGKKIRWTDGVDAAYTLLKLRFVR